MTNTYKVLITVSRRGKIGKIFKVDKNNDELLLFRREAPTFRDLSRKLRKTGLIPTRVALSKKGWTTFEK